LDGRGFSRLPFPSDGFVLWFAGIWGVFGATEIHSFWNVASGVPDRYARFCGGIHRGLRVLARVAIKLGNYMAYQPELQQGEKLDLQLAFQVSEKATPFHFAVSDQAVYWPAMKAFAVSDATFFKRLRHGQIMEVCVRRVPPYGYWVLAVLMILAGAATGMIMYQPLLTKEPGEHHVSGWPVALVVGGILLPFASQGRLRLEVITQDKVYKWLPPLVVDKSSRERTRQTLDAILASCEKAGLKVTRPVIRNS
jgi:hypothetical protein